MLFLYLGRLYMYVHIGNELYIEHNTATGKHNSLSISSHSNSLSISSHSINSQIIAKHKLYSYNVPPPPRELHACA